MPDYDKWDRYYDGGFATDWSTESFGEEYEFMSEYDEYEYYDGPKTNVTIKQIQQLLGVNKITDKFLCRNKLVVILLDYSKGIYDKWKNGTVLYCNGERSYPMENDLDNLTKIDKLLFEADSTEKEKAYVFWKEGTGNYRFINGSFVLAKKPYQVEENGAYRWVFPLAMISRYHFRMPEKYSFYVDTRKIKQSVKKEEARNDELRIVDLNENASFNRDRDNVKYKKTPQKKVMYKTIQEKIDRSRKTVENALILADFKCEFDKEHPSFMRENQNVLYTEAHHLVPLAYSELFKYSLDVEENIVSLCSTCHNQIHYGQDASKIIKKLYAIRKDLLEAAGIELSEQELLSMYGY